MRFTQLATVVLSTVMVAACADQLRPTAPQISGDARRLTPDAVDGSVRYHRCPPKCDERVVLLERQERHFHG